MQYRILLFAFLASTCAFGQLPDFRPPTPLLGALLRNDGKEVKKLLDAGANPNERSFFGMPPLTIALIHSNPLTVREMLARGANPNAADRNGSTPLMWAVYGESPDLTIVDELLKLGADPNAVNKSGESALTWASRRGDMRTVERLKAAGASDAAAIRESVEKAVALLQKSGPQFTKVSGCVSCHHQSLAQMAYGAARSRGYHVDQAVSDQQVEAVMNLFRPIREQMEKGVVNLPNPGISVSYALLGLEAEGYATDETTSAMLASIIRTQLPDGSFPVLPARPPMEASSISATALSVRALERFGTGVEERIARASDWLKNAVPSNQEERSMKLLGLAWARADRADIDRAAADLLARQHPDGGWSQLDSLESDAYATGQAMVALLQSGALQPSRKPYQHGLAFLLRNQLPDGSWVVRTRSSPVQVYKESGFPHGKHQWISAAGTSWAVMALSLSQPKEGQPVGGMF